MKIFLIIPTLKQGGAERVMSELANELAKLNHEVFLILLVKANDFYNVEPTVKVHRLDFKNKGGIRKMIDEIIILRKLRKMFKENRPDTTLCFMHQYNILTIVASRFLNLNIFISDRDNPKRKQTFLISFLKKCTYRYATGIVAQTTMAKEMLSKFTGNKNIKVISNPLREVQLFPDIKRDKIIVSVGRLIPEKGHILLLESFHELNMIDWKLVILGEGPMKGILKRKAIELNIDDRVHLLGAITNVDEWLARSSVFAFTSLSEGFPNALIEAMAAGLPCVSFDCDSGPRDIIKNGENGFLVPLKDYTEFTNKLRLLIEQPLLRESIGIKATEIRERLNKRTIISEFIDFIKI